MEFIDKLASYIGIQTDMLKIVLTMVFCMLLSPIFHIIKDRFTRNIYALIPGVLIILFMVQIEWIPYVLLGPIFFYLIINISGRHKFTISLILAFAFILFVHIYRYIYDYLSWKVDCSVFVMFLSTKVTYYGKFMAQKQNSKNSRKYSMLDYLGYCFFFPSVSIGPTFSFQTYLDFIERKNDYEDIKISIKSSLGLLLFGIVLMAITAVIIPQFPNDWVVTNQVYQSWGYFIKMNSLLVIGFFYRLKFYAAWYITQTSINLSGISYDGKGNYDNAVTGSILFELNPNPKNRTQYWNSSIQKWLKDVIFLNINSIVRSSQLSTYLTFLASALWHGVYLTYYIGFIQWGIVIHLTKWVYKWSLALPKWFISNFLTKLLALWLSSYLMSVIGMQIVILQWQNAMQFNADLKYSHLIFLAVFLVISMVVKPPRQKKPYIDPKSA